VKISRESLRSRILPIAVCLTLVAAACGSDDSTTEPTSATEQTPVETDAPTETDAPAEADAPAETDAPTDTTATTDTSEARGAIGGSLPDTPMSDEDAAVIDEISQQLVAGLSEFGATALYVGVWDPETGAYNAAYGVSNSGGPDATVDDSFRIGSITKTVTATVILELVDEGALSLDDTVADLLPDLASEYPDIAGITVQQLLSMTSGIADYINVPDTVAAVVVEDPSTVWEAEELIAIGVDGGVTEPATPGYSTTNYIILQLIAEDLTGLPLADAIAERVAEPLGMDVFFLPPNDDTTLPDPASAGYVAGPCLDEFEEVGASLDGPTETTDWNVSYGQGGGGITATIGDLGAWAGTVMGTSMLSDELAVARQDYVPIEEGLNYGLGLIESGSWVGHTGEVFGWDTAAFHNPETGVTVAFAANGCGGLIGLGFLSIMETLYPDTGALTLAGF
jgi:D-alanyl-D-alanine carboxypeptidase